LAWAVKFFLTYISVNTEITKISDIQWLQGWVLYDETCPSCRGFASRFEGVLTRRGFDLAPLQSAWVADCLNEGVDLSEMRVITVTGESFGGADALIFLARRIWWAWPIYVLSQVSGVRSLLRRAYAFYAARRHCDCGAGEVPQACSHTVKKRPAQ
jgi:predicted DCC family thiol-disulfide oxidoreductase YuxK